MWARVKGATENALLRLPLAAYMFRPGVIQPMHGERSKTRLYRVMYVMTGWVIPVLIRVFPKYVTTTERMGRAMIEVAKHGAANKVIETRDINDLAQKVS